MSTKIELVTMATLPATPAMALEQLHDAVHPPQTVDTSPGAAFVWASSEWAFLVWRGDELVAHVGLVARDILSNGRPTRIGGVGGVMSHPDHRGKGYVQQALQATAAYFATTLEVAYALLFCRAELIPFYGRAGWQPFPGQVYVDQPTGKILFVAEGPMVLDVQAQAPRAGVIDLQGLPW